MSETNGVIRIARKGVKKFAFGDGEPFEVDVVGAFQGWINIDEAYREPREDRVIAVSDMEKYNQDALDYVTQLAGGNVILSLAEALDFIARLREAYDEVAHFFVPNLKDAPNFPDSTETELQFSEEPAN